MSDLLDARDRPAPARATILKALLLTACAVTTFLAGRLWSLREVRDAQRAAGQAEEGRLALQAELIECRNALLLLQRDRGEATGTPADRGQTGAGDVYHPYELGTDRPPP
ncbi:MAG TPA: hypothetical protein VF590_16335 [Isosphaeraceae bacterium]|jgi:hypothetical protein